MWVLFPEPVASLEENGQRMPRTPEQGADSGGVCVDAARAVGRPLPVDSVVEEATDV